MSLSGAPSAGRLGTGEEEQNKNDQNTRCQDLSELFAMRYSKIGDEEIPVRRANRGKQERCCLRLTLRMRRSGE
jgi:hypothetical protein